MGQEMVRRPRWAWGQNRGTDYRLWYRVRPKFAWEVVSASPAAAVPVEVPVAVAVGGGLKTEIHKYGRPLFVLTGHSQEEVAGLAAPSAGLVPPKRPPVRVFEPAVGAGVVLPAALGFAAPPAAFVVPENKPPPAVPLPLVPVEPANPPDPKIPPPEAAGLGKLEKGPGIDKKSSFQNAEFMSVWFARTSSGRCICAGIISEETSRRRPRSACVRICTWE